MNETVLAIDFGTSNSLVGGARNGQRIEALPLDPASSDPTLMRTLLYFPSENECHYGASAIEAFLDHDMEGRLFRSFKTHLRNRDYLGTFVETRVMTLENMIGTFLLELKRRSERHLKCEVTRAVIGRPARYSMDPEEDGFALYRMGKAAEFAGFKEVTFVPEPLAAALDLRRQIQDERIALIGDFGGGTSDFTVIRLGPYDFEKEHVLGMDGCPLAGDALDSLFMSRRLNRFFGAEAEYKVSLGRNRMRMPISIIERLEKPAHIVHLKEPATYEFIREVRKGALNSEARAAIDRLFVLIEDQQIFSFFEAIEKSKRDLSTQSEADFHFDYPDIEVASTFQRSEFENWATDTRTKIFAAMDEALRQAGLTSSQIDLVCLTGGSAQVPLIRAEFERRFGSTKLQTQAHFHSVLSGLIESARLQW